MSGHSTEEVTPPPAAIGSVKGEALEPLWPRWNAVRLSPVQIAHECRQNINTQNKNILKLTKLVKMDKKVLTP